MTQYNFKAQKPSERYYKCDLGFLVATLLLWGLGLFTVFVCSQSYTARFFNGDSFYFVKRQLICSCAGLVLFFVLLFVDIKTIKKMVFYLVIITFILCAMTFIKPLSVERNGARRWLRMPFGFSFQPSELVKLTVVLYLAYYFDKIHREENKDVLPCVGIMMGLVIFVLLQKDFSTSMFIALIGVLMFFVSGSKLTWFIPAFFLSIPMVILVIGSQQYRINRLIGFIRPNEGGESFNFQVNRAKDAISAGGIWGVGIGKNLSKLNSIPEVQADYIFAGWTESMGYVGVVIFLLLLLFFAWRGYKSALKCPDRFASYGAFGCVTVIVLQSLLNCMVVCGLLPSTGIPLPFFSVGGSSIIITLGMCGFILNASRCEESEESPYRGEEISVENLTVI